MINIYVRGLHDFSGAYLVYVFPKAHAVLGDPFDFVKVSTGNMTSGHHSGSLGSRMENGNPFLLHCSPCLRKGVNCCGTKEKY